MRCGESQAYTSFSSFQGRACESLWEDYTTKHVHTMQPKNTQSCMHISMHDDMGYMAIK